MEDIDDFFTYIGFHAKGENIYTRTFRNKNRFDVILNRQNQTAEVKRRPTGENEPCFDTFSGTFEEVKHHFREHLKSLDPLV